MTKKTLNVSQVMSELKGESVFFQHQPQNEEKPSPAKEKPQSIQEKPTSKLPESGTSELTDIPTYELRNFAHLWRLDIRLTGDQKRFLTELEDQIRAEIPEGEANNPSSKRITKNSILRVFVEIFRHLRLDFDASQFMNENDLLKALYRSLLEKLTNFQTSEVGE